MKKPTAPKGFITIGTLLVIFASMPVASTLLMRLRAENQILTSAEEAPEADVALVLGAAAYPNGLSEVLSDRMDTAIELHRSGKVVKLILSGAPNEVEKMKEYALEDGIGENDLIEDPKGLNTLASLSNSGSIRGKILIVSQDFHLPRALFYARILGLKARGVSADRRTYLRIFEFKKRELLAASKAMAEVYLLR